MIQLPKNQIKPDSKGNKNKFIFIEGKNGSGKTFKSAQISHEMFDKTPLILSIDRKAEKTRLPAVNIETVEQFKQYCELLDKNRATKEFPVIVFDVLSNLDDAVFEESAKRLGKPKDNIDWTENFGTQKRPYIDIWKEIIKQIIDLSKANANGDGYTVIVTDYTITIERKTVPTYDNNGKKNGEVVNIMEGAAITNITKKQIPFVLQMLMAECDEHIRTVNEYDSFTNKALYSNQALSSRNEEDLFKTIKENNPHIENLNANLTVEKEEIKEEVVITQQPQQQAPELKKIDFEIEKETAKEIVQEISTDFSW